MSATPSFERFDYLLRTNKHIERKLVFDVLSSAAQKIDFLEHWYLGFGSMWFGDFRLAHRLLGINKLVSMELNDHAARANFNRPFAGVTVEPGESGAVMAGIAPAVWEKPVIAWLDYDGYLNNEVVRDIDLVLGQAQPNSAVIITVNGARGTYRVRKAGGGGITAKNETSVGVVEGFLGGGSIPAKYDPQPNEVGAYTDVSEALFPQFLTEAISAYMEHQVIASAREANGNRLKFLTLYRLHHRDGADMVTVGGVVVTEADAEIWRECLNRQALLVDQNNAVAYCRLDLIPVTIKEKIVLDECLPDGRNGANFLAAAKAAGLALHDDDIEKYRKFYRHFPVFIETTM